MAVIEMILCLSGVAFLALLGLLLCKPSKTNAHPSLRFATELEVESCCNGNNDLSIRSRYRVSEDGHRLYTKR